MFERFLPRRLNSAIPPACSTSKASCFCRWRGRLSLFLLPLVFKLVVLDAKEDATEESSLCAAAAAAASADALTGD